MEVHVLPALNDNYNFIFHCEKTSSTTAVDISEAALAIDFLDSKGWSLNYLLNTHHHYDHIGGNIELKEKYDCTVFGSQYDFDRERIPAIDVAVGDGDEITTGSYTAEILFIPGHTLGHIAYWFKEERVLFCGDTLFAMGCGRLFEGTPEQMHNSLQRLAQLPSDTSVYCAHEYTLANAEFCLSIDGDNEALQSRYQVEKQRRAKGQFTIPTTIEKELATNSFIRAKNSHDFARIRKLKDNF